MTYDQKGNFFGTPRGEITGIVNFAMVQVDQVNKFLQQLDLMGSGIYLTVFQDILIGITVQCAKPKPICIA